MVKMLEITDQASELIEKANDFTTVGLQVESLGDIWDYLTSRAREFLRDEVYCREEGDEPYPKSIPGKLAKDYGIEALNRVFGANRFALEEGTKDLLLKYAVGLAMIAIKEEIERTIE